MSIARHPLIMFGTKPVSGFDADAQAFFDATGITDTTQKNAVNTLVTDLKGYSLWSKMKAIYPMVGGTATTHKFNLKDPRDLDAAFRLSFSGGWTHASTGAKPNGTNGYADTFYIPIAAEMTNFAFGYYGTTNETAVGAKAQIGNYGTTQAFNTIVSRYNTTSMLLDIMWNGDIFTGITNGNSSLGLHSATATATDTQAIYKNGSLVNSFTKTTPAFVLAFSLFLGATNYNGSSIFYSDTTHGLSFICSGLNATENTNLYTAVQAFQTTLARNV